MREAKQEVQEEEQSKQEGSEEEGSTREARQGKRLSRFSRSENAPRMQMMERDKQAAMATASGSGFGDKKSTN